MNHTNNLTVLEISYYLQSLWWLYSPKLMVKSFKNVENWMRLRMMELSGTLPGRMLKSLFRKLIFLKS